MSINTHYAQLAATRRQLVFEAQRQESPTERRVESRQAVRLLTEAATACVRAGNPAAANTILAAIANIESGQA